MTRPIVLVHGAWHGAWCWQRVTPHLVDAGHRVHAPTLTGLAERAHLASPQVGLHLHAEDVAAYLRCHDLRDAVLVGHSYAGFVVREAADREPDRVAMVALLDAWFGEDGESLTSRAPGWFDDAISATVADEGFGWLCPPPPPELVGVSDETDAAWLQARLTPQPVLTFREATTLGGAVDRIPHRAAVCAEGIGLPFAEWARAVDDRPTVLDCGHDAMILDPGAVARFVHDAAS